MELEINFDALRGLQASYARAPDVVRQELLAAMLEADQLLLREVKEQTPAATGTLRSSEHAVERVQPFGVQGLVGSSLSYAEPVELGTKPHFPPVEALMDWVKSRFSVRSEREARSIAFLIARKISRVGTRGAGMYQKALAACEGQIRTIFDRAQQRIAARLAGG